jgi:hypothetical protein
VVLFSFFTTVWHSSSIVFDFTTVVLYSILLVLLVSIKLFNGQNKDPSYSLGLICFWFCLTTSKRTSARSVIEIYFRLVASGGKTKLRGIFFFFLCYPSSVGGDSPHTLPQSFFLGSNIIFVFGNKITKSGVHIYFSQMGQIFNCY